MHGPILYLASASPRRHEILKQLQIPHQVIQVPTPKGDDEPRLAGETPQDYVRRTACEKAVRAAQWLKDSPQDIKVGGDTDIYTDDAEHRPAIHRCTQGVAHKSTTGIYVLSADTTVILEDDILGKPLNRMDAVKILRTLSGKVHHVHTAIALHHDSQLFEALSISTVHFKELSDEEIDAYCATGDPMGKAGAYGIQGPAAAFISHLSGSYTGVMGLPAYETRELLAMAGYLST